jgi:hypothetical protein
MLEAAVGTAVSVVAGDGLEGGPIEVMSEDGLYRLSSRISKRRGTGGGLDWEGRFQFKDENSEWKSVPTELLAAMVATGAPCSVTASGMSLSFRTTRSFLAERLGDVIQAFTTILSEEKVI